jgi:Arc/MetJ-type ribon-helix-helix transcriptional regulator
MVLRLPPTLRDKIESAAAAARYRSTSEFVRNVLEDALATRDAQSELALSGP